MLIDSHCHLDMFEADELDAVLDRAAARAGLVLETGAGVPATSR